MLHLAAREHDIDLSRSWVIGDKVSDSDAGRAAGCRAVLVRTGHALPACAEAVADLRAALELWRSCGPLAL
jgi:D-glycero-D-manno-heptose 1,7-bisphosphate phosphatase